MDGNHADRPNATAINVSKLADRDRGGMVARPVLLVCSVAAAAALFYGPTQANVAIIGPP